MSMVQAYTSAEVHSIKGSPGDIADVGIFSNNADKTVFEFLESFELRYIDWGNNRQGASKLCKHLSADLRDKLMTRSDNYALIREWLISNYEGAFRIVNDTIMALGAELKDCLYSRNTLTLLGKLLITQDYDEYIREMTRRSLDWRNPLGQDTYECFKYIYTMERNMLEAARDNGGFNTSTYTITNRCSECSKCVVCKRS